MMRRTLFLPLAFAAASFLPLHGTEKPLPEKMQTIMQQAKYQHSSWGLHVRDAQTGQILFDLHSNQMFLPASTTKLFSVEALLHAYGDQYRFKTPIYAMGEIQKEKLQGNLVLVAQGDLTMGGRQDGTDTIAFTKMDHIIANNVPGAILTPQNPLHGIQELAKQVRAKGIKEVAGDVLIDDRLFEVTVKRDMILSPIMINENLIDLVLNPVGVGEAATLSWRPQVPGYSVTSEVKTVAAGQPLDLRITSDELGRKILIQGTLPADQKNLVRTFSIKDPVHFARAALIDALQKEGITVTSAGEKAAALPSGDALKKLQPIALWTSPPLSEYAKLILKVSHNLGADLVPLLLAVKKGEKTFPEGMRALGDFVTKDVGISSTAFVFGDGAGGDENRATPQAETQLLEYVRKLPPEEFKRFQNALPILGVDGSLADFGKGTKAVGKVYAKPGTGVFFNTASNQFFLTTQTLAGYIEGKNGHLLEFMLSVNNAQMPTIEDVFAIFEDLSQMTAVIYDVVE